MNIVEQIFDAVGQAAQDAFGQDYIRLKRVFDISKNDFRSINRAFGVQHGGASSAAGVTRVYTMDQEFRVILVNRYVDRDNDREIQSTLNDMYSKIDEFLQDAFLSKLGLSSVVLNVDSPAISEPELVENGCCVLTVSFNVKYRQAVTG